MIFRQEAVLGINNVDDAKRAVKVTFGQDSIDLSGDVSACVNYRLTKDGIAVVRNGRTSKLTVSGGHSFWVNKAGNLAFYVLGTALYRLNASYTATSLYTVTVGRRMTYFEHNDQVFMGNGAQMLVYRNDAIGVWGNSALWPDTTDSEKDWYGYKIVAPPLSNIIGEFRARVYAADGRFLLYSIETYPHAFRRAHNLVCPEEITALSFDRGNVYAHGFNTTTIFSGSDPEDFTQSTVQIGAIKHGSINVLGVPYIMTPRGWGFCHDGIVEYVDDGNFRLDLPTTAEAVMGYNPITKETICRIKQ